MEPVVPAQHPRGGVLPVAVTGRAVVRPRRCECPPSGRTGAAGRRWSRPGPAVRRRRYGCRDRRRCAGGRSRGRVGVRRGLELPWVAVGCAGQDHDRAARRDLGVPHRGGCPRQAEGAVDGRLEPQALLDEGGDQAAVVAEPLLELGALGEGLEGGAQEPGRGLLAGGEQVGGDLHHVLHRGERAVGEGGRGQSGHHIVTGLTPPVLDVAGEPGVEVLERAVGHLDGAGVHELLEELRMVLLGHAEEVGDDQHGVGLGVLADELALPPGVEPVDLVVGQPL